MAAALRHSRKHAQQTYDKRTSNERKGAALSLASQFIEEEEEQQGSTRCATSGQLSVGDFVGLIEKSSTLSDPHVLIGQIQEFLPDRQASLLWFDQTGKSDAGRYSFQFEPDSWIEHIDSLCRVRMSALKRQPGVFKLNTPLKAIHTALGGNT